MDVLSYGLLATAMAMVAVQNLNLLVGLVIVQALLLGAQSLLLGVIHGDGALYWAALLTFAIKGAAVPLLLRYIIQRIQVMRVVDIRSTTKVAILIAVGLTLVAYSAAGSLTAIGGNEGEALPLGLAVMLIGLFLMVSRRIALTQVVGLLVMENGLFLAALGITEGLPLLVDVGIFFDVLVSAAVMGILVYRINTTFESMDTSALRRLRG